MNENYKKPKKIKLAKSEQMLLNNYKNPKIRNEIKKQILAELEFEKDRLPIHRKWECQAILSEIQAWETHELRKERLPF